MAGEFVSVYILDSPYHADKMYDYFVPEGMEGAGVGSIVTVPFGRANRKTAAVIREVKDVCDADKAKPLSDVTRPYLLSPELLELCDFMKEHTLCTFGEAVRAAVPSAAVSRISEYFSAAEDVNMDKLGERPRLILSFIRARGRVSAATLKQEFGADAVDAAGDLVRAGYAVRERESSKADGIRRQLYCSLKISEAEAVAILEGDAELKLRSTAQAALLRALLEAVRDAEDGQVTAERLFEMCPEGDRVRLRALEKKGVVRLNEREVIRNPYTRAAGGDPEALPPLTEEQTDALLRVEELLLSGEPKAALLHGVTGSGKTRVIIESIRRVLAEGRDAIVLVPEIALTPQAVSAFTDVFGDRVAVMHSALSAGERFDAWRRVKRGEADVVIGTRSAVFAPVERLGLIVIDEEQEHTYKSDTSPKYLAHDIARKRCAENKALMLLSSATPSLQSYHKAKTGAYTLIEMKNRIGEATLPQVVVCDTRGTPPGASPYGEELARRLRENAEAGEQSIIFLNRRGYSSVLSCRKCGEPVRCPNCSVSLTYHTHRRLSEGEGEEYLRRRADSGSLSCHYCGYRTRVPVKCPSCESEHMLFAGYGTQRAEEELERLLPKETVLRLDADTTAAKFSHDEILSKFRRGESRALIGTQIVTKGHDFPGVTLVGVLNADASLYLDDYRAAERTFAMLTQVIGRAGRASSPGTAVVQTQNPDSDVIRLAALQDYPAFYEQEIRIRRGLVFPPFCDIAVLTLTSPDEALLEGGAKRLSEEVHGLLNGEFSDVRAIVFGPFEAPVYKVQNKCRMRMVIKCKNNARTRRFLSKLITDFGHRGTRRMSLGVDINPSSL